MNWGVGTWGENRQMMDILRRRIVCRPGRSAERHQAVSPDGASHACRRQLLQAAGSAGGCADDLKGWYALREVYISPESTASVDAHSPQLTKRVQEDFLSLSPLYHLLRGAYEAIPPEEVDKMVQKMRR